MTLSRRQLLKLAAGSFIFFGFHRAFAAGFPELAAKVLPVFLDTLIPADESPSASDLQVDGKLLKRVEQDPSYAKLLEYGCVWLEQNSNREYQKSFWQITHQQRHQIVILLASKHPSNNAHRFFTRVQRDSFELYYSDPESWQGLQSTLR